MHWHNNTRCGVCPYGYMDAIAFKCSQCKAFSICTKNNPKWMNRNKKAKLWKKRNQSL